MRFPPDPGNPSMATVVLFLPRDVLGKAFLQNPRECELPFGDLLSQTILGTLYFLAYEYLLQLNYSQLKGQVRVIVSEAGMCRTALFPPQRVCSLTWVPQASSDKVLS